MPRIGFLIAGDPYPAWGLFRKSMTELGYIEGRTVTYEYRAVGGDESRLAALAAELVALKVDVLVPVLSPALAAASKATSSIPIVFFAAAPEVGGVNNLARPEGNLTGVYSPSSATAGKSIQLFHEVQPQAKAIGALLNERDPFHVPLLRDIEAATTAEKIELKPVLVKSHDEVPHAFETLQKGGVAGIIVQPSLGLKELAALGLQFRAPTFSFRREFVELGGLMSYGANQAEMYSVIAGYVDKVLKGTKPSSLPVQQASKFELAVNQSTARTLGIVFPPTFLARVDEVIE
jgi:putative ABC transport system substrate-binding protein